jgi:hypothetical protein
VLHVEQKYLVRMSEDLYAVRVDKFGAGFDRGTSK